ncbi:HD domain-containing protein [Candidatus Pacearchaeota archaeon]|nr:HD domain-containing protein [Candidatus Pacearchaeota archaeon]
MIIFSDSGDREEENRKKILLEKSIKLAVDKHCGQVDRSGSPYILHCLRVMNNVPQRVDIMIAAVLHDIVEDTNISFYDLWKMEIDDNILLIIDLLTRQKTIEYFDYIERLKNNEMACAIKLADIEDNINLLRLNVITDADKSLVDRYHKAYSILIKHGIEVAKKYMYSVINPGLCQNCGWKGLPT